MRVVSSADPVLPSAVAAISGAAGAIGAAVVEKFVSRGVLVVALDHNPSALEELTSRHGDMVLPVLGDAADPGTLHELSETISRLGSLHHVIPLAGGATETELGKEVSELTVAAFRASVESNLLATWSFLEPLLGHLISSSGERSLTFCSSRNALAGHGIPAYSSAKAALSGLMHPLAVELGPHGIRVNTVAPGQVATPFARKYHSDQPGHFESIAAASCLGRLASEEDVAAAFACLALDMHAVTGQTVVVDAGAHIWRAA